MRAGVRRIPFSAPPGQDDAVERREGDEREAVHGTSTHGEDGVDLTLVRWMLSLTPEERLRVLQEHNDAIVAVSEASQHDG
jgi:hypothetical protein